MPATRTFWKLSVGGENHSFGQWVDTFMENYSKPPYRTQKTHVANLRAVKHLKATFMTRNLLDISPDDIESYLRKRMRQRALIKTALGYQRTLRTGWRLTLRRAEVPYFRLYDLRSTYATRLSAGDVADEWVTQLLRQSDSKVFKKYSQMKLRMQREAIEKMNRQANEMTSEVTTAVQESKSLCTVPAQF
jgi:integrase